MDEKKIIEKRSSFRGWKERNKGKLHIKKYITGIVVLIIIFSFLIAYPYLNPKDGHIKNKKNSSNINNKNVTPKETTPMPTPITPKMAEKEIITGEIGVPFKIDEFNITVKSVYSSILYINVWIVVKNIDNKERSFKISPGTVVTDNIGEQYEKIRVKRSAEIVQTNLTAKAIREGAIFFERLKEGRQAKKLLLNINGQKAEISLKK